MQKFNPLGENRLLKRLAADDFSLLQPNLKEISMVQGAVLHAPGESIEHVYFPISGMVSILAVMRTGEQIETAIVGREGVVGASIGSDGSQSAGQATVQIEGSAWQVQASKFSELYKASEPFRTLMNRFQYVIFLQAQQSAACHALHYGGSSVMPLALAIAGHNRIGHGSADARISVAHVRGTTNSVSLCAHTLQKAGLIRYSRGQIKILDRNGLKESACECYDVVREHVNKAVPPLS